MTCQDRFLDVLVRERRVDHVDRGIGVAELGRRASRAFEGAARVLAEETDRQPPLHRRPVTTADVWLPESPEGTARRVRIWAASIRSQLGSETPGTAREPS